MMAPTRSPILDVRGLRKSFGGTEVLKGIDLAVEPQELVFIIGPSGAGKSTFLRCLNRLEEPTSGSIFVDGIDLLDPKTDINAMRRRIGMVFQAFNLYPHMTALGNVTLALEPKVMLFDEPTSALDPELVGSVLAVMRDLQASGMTMVVASHEMRFAREAAHRVVFMEDGLVCDEGPPARIFGPDANPRARQFLAGMAR